MIARRLSSRFCISRRLWLPGAVALTALTAGQAMAAGSIAAALQRVSRQDHTLIVVGADQQALNRPISTSPGANTTEALNAAAAALGVHRARFGNVIVFPRNFPEDWTKYKPGAKDQYDRLGLVMDIVDSLTPDQRDPGRQLGWDFDTLTSAQQQKWKQLFKSLGMGTFDGKPLSGIWDRPAVEKKMKVYLAFDVTFGLSRYSPIGAEGYLLRLPDRWKQILPPAAVPWKSAEEENAAFADSSMWAAPDPYAARIGNLKLFARTTIPATKIAAPGDIETKTAGEWISAAAIASGAALNVDARIADERITIFGAAAPVSASNLLGAIGMAADSGSAWGQRNGVLLLSAQNGWKRSYQAMLEPGEALNQRVIDTVFRWYPAQMKAMGLNPAMFTVQARPLRSWPAPVQDFVQNTLTTQKSVADEVNKILPDWKTSNPLLGFSISAQVEMGYDTVVQAKDWPPAGGSTGGMDIFPVPFEP